jgi:hypothetical protein
VRLELVRLELVRLELVRLELVHLTLGRQSWELEHSASHMLVQMLMDLKPRKNQIQIRSIVHQC